MFMKDIIMPVFLDINGHYNHQEAKAMNTVQTDIDNLKVNLKANWTVGDFGRIARFLTNGASEFVERLNLKPGLRVLDIGCGTGNQSIPAARTGAIVTGVDIAPNLLAQARRRASAEYLTIYFEEGDAERLLFGDGEFDVVFSMFGAIFAPRHDRVATELVRVCRPGGRIAMTSWTSDGFVGKMFKIIAAHLPPANSPSPLLWGDNQYFMKNFGEAISSLEFTRRYLDLIFPYSISTTLEIWREYYGPLRNAFEKLDSRGRQSLLRSLERFWAAHNTSQNGETSIKAEYLEVIATRNVFQDC